MMQRLAVDFDWSLFLKRHDLVYERIPGRWEEGPFLGNGLLGALFYNRPESHENPAHLRFDIGRSDVAERHPRGNHRLPVGYLTLAPTGRVVREFSGRLILWDALWEGKLTTDAGAIAFRAFVAAEENVLVVEAEPGRGEAVAFEWHPERSLNPRSAFRKDVDPQENPPPSVETREDGVVVCVQPLNAGGEYATAYLVQPGEKGRTTTLYLSVGFTYEAKGGAEEAVAAVRAAAAQGVDALRRGHERWWHGYYPQSFVSIPDTRLESFYWIQIYKLASATRAARPVLDLMGPWFRETPWPAIWWNLNLQLTYWPVYAANRLHLGESLLRFLDANRENLIANAPRPWRADSAAVARVTGYDGVGPVKVAHDSEYGNLTWALHNVYLHYRHAMDDAVLRDTLMPLLRRAVGFYVHLLEEGKDGHLHLPPSYSPEFASAPDCNYDLALLRWGCQTLLDSADRLGGDEPDAPGWSDVLERLAPFPHDSEQGYLIGRGVPLDRSHRHFSHLLMFYPLRLTSTERPEERALAEQSLDHWLGREGSLQGYTLTGGASMAALLGRREQAASLLNDFIDRYLHPNTMYTEAGPVIETPLSGANTLQEMLLRSEPDGSFRVFPAVPDAWRDAVFHDLRAQGAFLVSARRVAGRTEFVRVRSLAGEPCRVRADFHGPVEATYAAGRRMAVHPAPDGTYAIELRKGDTAFLAARGANVDLRLRPVAPMPGAFLNWFGVRR